MNEVLGQQCSPWLPFTRQVLRIGVTHYAVRDEAFGRLIDAWGGERKHIRYEDPFICAKRVVGAEDQV